MTFPISEFLEEPILEVGLESGLFLRLGGLENVPGPHLVLDMRWSVGVLEVGGHQLQVMACK